MDTLPVFFPDPEYVPELSRDDTLPLSQICRMVGLKCRASGNWTERPVRLFQADGAYREDGRIISKPQGGTVYIHVPQTYCGSEQDMARYALGALAYSGLFDLVARASIKAAPWRKCG
jgi:hypothetical protein